MRKVRNIFGFFAFLLLAGCWQTGEVNLSGYIIKMDGTGIIWRTNEAKMMEGSLNSGHVSSEITVPPQLADSFEEAMFRQVKVKVTYERELFVAPWRGAGGGIATKIVEMEESDPLIQKTEGNHSPAIISKGNVRLNF